MKGSWQAAVTFYGMLFAQTRHKARSYANGILPLLVSLRRELPSTLPCPLYGEVKRGAFCSLPYL